MIFFLTAANNVLTFQSKQYHNLMLLTMAKATLSITPLRTSLTLQRQGHDHGSESKSDDMVNRQRQSE